MTKLELARIKYNNHYPLHLTIYFKGLRISRYDFYDYMEE